MALSKIRRAIIPLTPPPCRREVPVDVVLASTNEPAQIPTRNQLLLKAFGSGLFIFADAT